MKTLFEAQFNNNKNLICRVSAKDKTEAISKFKEVYPNWEVTKIYQP